MTLYPLLSTLKTQELKLKLWRSAKARLSRLQEVADDFFDLSENPTKYLLQKTGMAASMDKAPRVLKAPPKMSPKYDFKNATRSTK